MAVSSPDTIPALPADMQAEIDSGTQAVIKDHSDKVLAKLDAEAGLPPEPVIDPIAEAAAKVEEATVAKPADKPAETEEEKERSGKLAQQLRKLQVKLVSDQQALSRQRNEVKERETKVQAQLQEHQQVVQLARQNPIEWLKRFAGLNEEDIAARLLNRNTPRAEELQRQYDEKYKSLEAELKSLKEQRDTERLSQTREEALKAFVGAARGNEERWPLASKWNESRLKAEGMRIAQEAKAAGTPLDDEGILDQIEEYLSEVATLRAPRSESASSVPKPAGSTVRKSPPKQPAPTLTEGSSDGAANEPTEPDADAVIALLKDKEGFSRTMSAYARRAAKANGLKRTGIDT